MSNLNFSVGGISSSKSPPFSEQSFVKRDSENTVVLGDIREACGASFVHGLPVPINISLEGKGTGDVILSGGNGSLVISSTGVKPNFVAMGFKQGDSVYIYDNNLSFSKKIITRVNPHSINFNGSPSPVGNDYSSMCLIPKNKMSITELNRISSSSTDKTVKGFEIVLEKSVDPNVIECPSNSFFKLENCVFAPIGIFTEGNSATEFKRCTFLNSSSNSSTIGSALRVGTLSSNKITECYFLGSANLIPGFMSAISCVVPTNMLTSNNVIINFRDTGIKLTSPHYNSINDRIINVATGIYNCQCHSVMYNSIIENITDTGIFVSGGSSSHIVGPSVTESSPSIGIKAGSLAYFVFSGVAGNVSTTTPFEPPVALTPGVTGGNGFGY